VAGALDTAGKLFLVTIFGLMPEVRYGSTASLPGAGSCGRCSRFSSSTTAFLLWGFLNYLFGIGVALVGAAAWLALEGRRWWLRVLASTFAALACFFSHIAAFGCYALVILGVEIVPAWGEFRARRWAMLAAGSHGSTPIHPPAALLLGGPYETPRELSAMPDLAQGRPLVHRVRQLQPGI